MRVARSACRPVGYCDTGEARLVAFDDYGGSDLGVVRGNVEALTERRNATLRRQAPRTTATNIAARRRAMRSSGSIADVQRRVPCGSWCRLLEPAADLATVLELAIGATICSAVFTLWVVATPLDFASLDDFARTTIIVIAIVVAPLHEAMHVWAFPRLDGGPRAVVRFSRRRILYASYDGVVSRERFLAVLVAPLAVVSLLPILLASLSATTPGTLLVISLLNTLASSGDVLTLILVACQVPRGCEIRVGTDTLAWKQRQAVA